MTGPDAHPAVGAAGPLVLASASPQRTAILERLGVAHEVRVADVVEDAAGDPEVLVRRNARRKAEAVAAHVAPGRLVLGADTVVLGADGRPLGKPADAAEARAMLLEHAGRAHLVRSAACLVRAGQDGRPGGGAATAPGAVPRPDRARSSGTPTPSDRDAPLDGWAPLDGGASPTPRPGEALEVAGATRVRFRAYGAATADWYVGTGEWRGRAGGYAVQERGGLLVDGIDGDWWTVVGLPVAALAAAVPALLGLPAPG